MSQVIINSSILKELFRGRSRGDGLIWSCSLKTEFLKILFSLLILFKGEDTSEFYRGWAAVGCVSLRAACECYWAQSCSDQEGFSGLWKEKSLCRVISPPSKQ